MSKIIMIMSAGSKPEFLKNIYFQKLYKWLCLLIRIGPANTFFLKLVNIY